MRWAVAGVLVATGLLMSGCCGGNEPRTGPSSPSTGRTSSPTPSATPTPNAPSAIAVTSPAFVNGAPIPARYSCRGANIPPALAWTGTPPAAGALALVLDDPDAVGGLYIHWVVTDIPPTTTASAEGAAPPGGQVGANSGGNRAYLGPCPPKGTGVHHYRFTLYALAKRLGLAPTTPARQAVAAITQAATGQGQLVGTFTG